MKICKSFYLLPYSSEANIKYFVGEISTDLEKKWNDNLREIWGTYYTVRNYLIDSFWEAIADLDVDIDWLVKVRTHLDKTKKKQAKIEQKKSISFSRNSQHKIMVFKRVNEHVSHFQIESEFDSQNSDIFTHKLK